jgi:hypothetical protein
VKQSDLSAADRAESVHWTRSFNTSVRLRYLLSRLAHSLSSTDENYLRTITSETTIGVYSRPLKQETNPRALANFTVGQLEEKDAHE